MGLISYRRRSTKVLTGATKGEKGNKGGGSRVRLSNIDTGELAGCKDKLICHFKLAADMVRCGIREFVNAMGRPAFLERELMRLDVDGYW